MSRKDKKNISYNERLRIEAYLEAGFTAPQIAEKLGRARSTVYKEISTGTRDFIDTKTIWKEVFRYDADYAQTIADEKASHKGLPGKYKNSNDLKLVEEMMLETGYSPDMCVGELKKKG